MLSMYDHIWTGFSPGCPERSKKIVSSQRITVSLAVCVTIEDMVNLRLLSVSLIHVLYVLSINKKLSTTKISFSCPVHHHHQ